ncbi:MAG: heterodisulfide reductase-related iron-sulfur binding cluster [Gemmatimonadota bacterium]
MRTEFRPMADRWLEDLLGCVHCGFCLPVCPTYEVLSEENDSPRGRIYLMRALAEGRGEAEAAHDFHVGRCLGCRACETACPAGVEYGSLLERARSRAAGRGARDRLVDLTLEVLTARGVSRFTWRIGRSLRAVGLDRLAARLVPGRMGLAAGMLAATRPAFGSAGRSAGTGRKADPAGRALAVPRESTTYSLLEGCVMQGLYGHVHDATRRTLARRRHEEVAAPGQGCCGALHAHAGRLEAARALARENLEAFERSGANWIVTDSAGCGAALREYPAWFRDDPDLRERALRFAAKVRDISELLVVPPADRNAGDRSPFPAGPVGRRPPRTTPSRRVAYDAPCHLLHAQGIRDAPMEALAAAGYEVEPLPSWERCCGGAGLYNLQQPELSDRVLDRKLSEIDDGEYDLVATGNPGGLMVLGSGLARAGMRVTVAHPVELVDLAEGNDGRGAAVPRSCEDEPLTTGDGSA